VILLLLLANGLFSMSEIAVVSARRRGSGNGPKLGTRQPGGARVGGEPQPFSGHRQVGITSVGTLAAAYGGANLAERLADLLARVSWLKAYAEPASLVLVVASITFVSLVIGELVPKRLGLANPEGIASVIAGPMRTLSQFAAPVVTLLAWCTDAMLKLLRLEAGRMPP
jgi:putative hemolysin